MQKTHRNTIHKVLSKFHQRVRKYFAVMWHKFSGRISWIVKWANPSRYTSYHHYLNIYVIHMYTHISRKYRAFIVKRYQEAES